MQATKAGLFIFLEVTLLVMFLYKVLDKVKRLCSFIDHQSNSVRQVAGVALIVPRRVDHFVIGFNLLNNKYKWALFVLICLVLTILINRTLHC